MTVLKARLSYVEPDEDNWMCFSYDMKHRLSSLISLKI